MDKSPTFRVPGASVAARAAEASGGGGTWADKARARAPGGATTVPQGDAAAARTAEPSGQEGDGTADDGFQVVTGRKGRRAGVKDAVGEGEAQGGGRPADGSAQRDVDDDAMHDDGHDEGGDDHGQPNTAALQKHWHDEVALVRRLRGQGLPDDHPVMRAACASRDEAEQAWRGSKEPAPASIRLGRAQQKLDRAVSLQAEARRAMLDAEAAHRQKMSVLQSTLDECAERVKLRRQQLNAVQEEVGAGSTQVAGARQAQQDAIRQVHETICTEVGPAIEALVERLETDAPAWATLNGLLGKLAASKATLESAAVQQPTQPTRYDIGDRGRDENDGADDDGTEWSESHDIHEQARETEDACWGWDGWGGERPCGTDHDQSMGTGDWWDTPTGRWGGATRWRTSGHGQWTRTNWADQLEEEQDAMQRGEGQPPAARRRLDAAGGDQATKEAQVQAQQQQQQHQQQRQQQSDAQHAEPRGAADAAAPEDPEEAKRRHNARVNRIVEMAVEAGVTPLTKWGEDLLVLDPAQLDAWVAECLPAALLC